MQLQHGRRRAGRLELSRARDRLRSCRSGARAGARHITPRCRTLERWRRDPRRWSNRWACTFAWDMFRRRCRTRRRSGTP